MKKGKLDPILSSVDRYYSEKLSAHGASFRGVDWNSQEAQELRFEQLLKVCDRKEHFSLNEFGCGYGQLFGYMKTEGYDFDYLGFDIAEVMIDKAVEIYGDNANCAFLVGDMVKRVADYTVASGIFNINFAPSDSQWLEYIISVLNNMDKISKKGFSFNCLTKYSDKEYMRDDLYYADPCYLFDYCKRHFSRNVALLHDYELYDFTMIIRK